jgi:hypothetical protein
MLFQSALKTYGFHCLRWHPGAEPRGILSIKKNYDDLFANELNDWCTDEDTWPQNRNYKLFVDWFDIEIYSMLLDLEDTPVKK